MKHEKSREDYFNEFQEGETAGDESYQINDLVKNNKN